MSKKEDKQPRIVGHTITVKNKPKANKDNHSDVAYYTIKLDTKAHRVSDMSGGSNG